MSKLLYIIGIPAIALPLYLATGCKTPYPSNFVLAKESQQTKEEAKPIVSTGLVKKEEPKTLETYLEENDDYSRMLRDPKHPNVIGVRFFEDISPEDTTERQPFLGITQKLHKNIVLDLGINAIDGDYFDSLKPTGGFNAKTLNTDLSLLFEITNSELKEKRTFKPIGLYIGPKVAFNCTKYEQEENARSSEQQTLGGLEIFIPYNRLQLNLNALTGNGNIKYINNMESRTRDTNSFDLSASFLLSKRFGVSTSASGAYAKRKTEGIKGLEYELDEEFAQWSAGIAKRIKFCVFDGSLGADYFQRKSNIGKTDIDSDGFNIYYDFRFAQPTEETPLGMHLLFGYQQEALKEIIIPGMTKNKESIYVILMFDF